MIQTLSIALAALAVGYAVPACSGHDNSPPTVDKQHLEPPESLFREHRPTKFAEQPNRAKPRAVAAAPNRSRVYVALEGSVERPGQKVVAIDVDRRTVVRRYTVGHRPSDLALHPNGRHLLVANQYSNFMSVIDLQRQRVRSLPSDYYVTRLTFSRKGDRLYATNRWRDALQIWDATVDGGDLEVARVHPDMPQRGVPVAANPKDLAIDPEGSRIFVASPSTLTVTAIDTETLQPADVSSNNSKGRLEVGAPPNDLALGEGRLYVPTLADSTGHPPNQGPDTNGDGQPGDGTPNTNFNDVQNELAVFDLPRLERRVRYTSDSICCPEIDDVSPADPELGSMLPPERNWMVEGALPERAQLAKLDEGPALIVAYSGSSQLQKFPIAPDGSLHSGPTLSTGYNPMGLAVDSGRREAYVSNRLGETLSIVDLESFERVGTIDFGTAADKNFPATDVEIGELFFFAGASFSVDGDITCNHCHRQRGATSKTFHMPLLADPRGVRTTPDARGLFSSRPWFFEGAMTENNFTRELNRAAKSENFCCAKFPDREACETDLPETCASKDYPANYPTRDAFFLDRAKRTLGRTDSFGDSGRVRRLDSEGMADLLALFLMQRPGLLPNPNPDDTPSVRRGRRLFNSPSTGCAGCHPKPGFMRAIDFQPTPWVFGPVITPNRTNNGRNSDLVTSDFLESFSRVRQNGDVRMKATSLLGLWDRPAPFLHDGRAKNLRETVCSPDHPALRDGETGYNELDGLPDTHGGTSHLDASQISDLIAYLNSL